MRAENKKLRTPIDILEAALAKERDAYRFYDDLLKEVKVVMVQEILEKLRDEEHKHILMIEREITKTKRGS
jgi:rubrerythrin